MLIICRVYEDRQEHGELPAVVKARVGCILKDDGCNKNISRSNDCRQEGQQYQTHQESSKPHITILVKIFSIGRKYINSSPPSTLQSTRHSTSITCLPWQPPSQFKREKNNTLLFGPISATPEMSDKLRYDWQIAPRNL